MTQPIIGRELRVRSRRWETYWARLAVAMGGVLICLPQSAALGGSGVAFGAGRQLLDGFAGMAFILCCTCCLLSCDLISAERREGTLGLLFLTRVKTFDVLAGKLASVGLTSLCALVSLFPVMMIALLAGGISWTETLRMGAALLSTLLFALAAGLCASTLQRERIKAAGVALLIVLAGLLLPGIFFVSSSKGLAHLAGRFSPWVLIAMAGDPMYRSEPSAYWYSLAGVQAVVWGLLAGTGLLLRRAVREDNAAAFVRTPESIRETENAIGMTCWRPEKQEAQPLEWMIFRKHGVGMGAWALAVLSLAWSRWVSLHQQISGWQGASLLTWPLGLGGALTGGALIAWVSSRYFVEARRSRELELLLTTPLGAKTITSDQWGVLKRFFLWPMLAIQAAMLLPVLGSMTPAGVGLFSAGVGRSPLTALLSVANSVLGTIALCRVSLWFGLVIPRQTTVIVWTAGFVQGLPWLFSLFCSLVLAALVGSGARLAAMLWLPEAAIVLFYLWLIGQAKQGLAQSLAGIEAPFSSVNPNA